MAAVEHWRFDGVNVFRASGGGPDNDVSKPEKPKRPIKIVDLEGELSRDNFLLKPVVALANRFRGMLKRPEPQIAS